jgi:hypothetical protein
MKKFRMTDEGKAEYFKLVKQVQKPELGIQSFGVRADFYNGLDFTEIPKDWAIDGKPHKIKINPNWFEEID